MASTVDVRVSADAEGAVEAAAAYIAEYARHTIVKRRYAHLGFSGGSTGALLVRALADADLDWSRVMVRQIDERVAPDGDPGRNATALRAELLDRVPIPERNILLMDVTAADLTGAARAYANALRPLDLAHLGMGADGHTASWPPDQPDVRTTYERVTITEQFNGYRRMTLTQNGIAEVGHVVWLVCGADKRDPLRRALDGDPTLPATHAFQLRPKGPSHVPVFVDAAAAPGAGRFS